MKNKYQFLVKYGFSEGDKVIIHKEDLEKALYAQKFGVVAQLADRQINGKYIISITPYKILKEHRFTAGGEEKVVTLSEYENLKEMDPMIEEVRKKIDYLIKTNQKQLIGQKNLLEIEEEK